MAKIEGMKLFGVKIQQLFLCSPPESIKESGETPSLWSQSFKGIDLLSRQVDGGDRSARQRSEGSERPLMQIFDEPLVALPEADVIVLE